MGWQDEIDLPVPSFLEKGSPLFQIGRRPPAPVGWSGGTGLTAAANFPVSSGPAIGPNGEQVIYPQAAQSGGVDADMAIPSAAAPGGLPGYRRMIGQDFLQRILPSEQGPGGRDLMRQGGSAAEIQQSHPGWSATQIMQGMNGARAQQMADVVGNTRLQNEVANRNSGMLSNADFNAAQNTDIARGRLAQDVAASGINASSYNRRIAYLTALERQGVGPEEAARRADAAQRRGDFTGPEINPRAIPGLQGYDPNAQLIVTPQRPAGTVFNPNPSNTQNGGGNFPITRNDVAVDRNTPQSPVQPPTPPRWASIAETLNPAFIEAVRPLLARPAEDITAAQNQGLLPTIPAGHAGTQASITRFLQSLQARGPNYINDNLPAIMSFMVNNFRSENVDPWFAAGTQQPSRFSSGLSRIGSWFGGADSSPSQQQSFANMMLEAANRRGAEIGYRGPSRWLNPLGAMGSDIEDRLR